MRNTAGRGPAFANSALSVPRLRLGPARPGHPDILATLTSPAQPTGTALELSVRESGGGRLASPADAT